MTLGEGKALVLKLLDEYSSGGTISEDADINAKMTGFFDMAQRHMSGIKRVVKLYTVPLASGVTAYDMPADFARLYRVWEDGVPSRRRWGWKGNKLLVPATGRADALEVEYFATPIMPADAADTYEFELSEDAAACMPYWVAQQQLIVDLVVDYQPLMVLYQNALSSVDRSLPGDGGGRVRQTYYRRTT